MQYEDLSLYINGKFIQAGNRDVRAVHNPATGALLGKLPLAGQGDLDCALESAASAFRVWRKTSAFDRSKVLRKVAELIRERCASIATNITLDQGKPVAEATAEVLACADHAEWHAEECRRIYGRVVPSRAFMVSQAVLREPVGVCVAFTPWNFPFSQALRKAAAALGAGCTLVLKGPEDCPSAVVAMARIFHDAGLPPGCLNIVWGNPEEVSDYLIRSSIVRKVSFTGSVPVGKKLTALAGSLMKRTSMELGGHSPVIVCNDADIERAADLIVAFKHRNAGQVCAAPSRIYVQRSSFSQFVDRYVATASKIRVGEGLSPETTMGPLVHDRRIHAMEAMVADAIGSGAQVLLGGQRLERPGTFFPPTVIVDAAQDCRLMVDEPFGPISPIAAFDTLDEAIEHGNALPYGLAAYAFTKSLGNAHLLSCELNAGSVCINHFGLGIPEVPFGGSKDSGYGSEGGSETFDAYLNTKLVTHLTSY